MGVLIKMSKANALKVYQICFTLKLFNMYLKYCIDTNISTIRFKFHHKKGID